MLDTDLATIAIKRFPAGWLLAKAITSDVGHVGTTTVRNLKKKKTISPTSSV